MRTPSELLLEVRALAGALADPRTPRSARIAGLLVVAYALSPLDLVPDFIPVLGLLDDAVIVPLGIALTVRLIPPEVLADARARAAATPLSRRARIAGAAIVVALWALAAAVAVVLVRRLRP